MARILVIDDEVYIRNILRQLFEREGYEVLEASDGIEGMDIYTKEYPDLVITDLIMPNQAGIEMIMELRSSFPKVNVIAITGGGHVGTDTYLNVAKGLGAQRIFAKPFDLKDILSAVNEILKDVQ